MKSKESVLTKIMSHLCRGFDGGTMFEQQFHDLDPVLLAGNVERSEAVEGSCVRIGFAVQKKLCHTDMSTVGCYVESSQVIHCHLIHWGSVVQQDTCRIHVISLRSHVQGCKPVLQYTCKQNFHFNV